MKRGQSGRKERRARVEKGRVEGLKVVEVKKKGLRNER